jgi:hypothetical protein
VDVVDVAQYDGRMSGKVLGYQSFQEARLNEAAVNVGHASRNVLPELELLVAFADLHGAQLTGPVVDILEQVTMDCAQVLQIEVAVGDRLCGALRDDAALGPVELDRINEPQKIAKDVRAGNDVRIANGHVSAEARAALRM